MTYFLVDGEKIKAARDTGQHEMALRVFKSGQPEKPAWSAVVRSGVLRVYRLRVEDKFKMELLEGTFDCASPVPDFRETTKHVYVQQTLRRGGLKALIFCQRKREALYHNDITIVGDCEITYDRKGRGFRGTTQLWVQTTTAQVVPAGPWTRVGPGASNPYLIDDLPR